MDADRPLLIRAQLPLEEVEGLEIGDRVEIGAGAVIIGAITVGDGAFIGPNAVVTSDVPPGARVIAPAGRVLPPVDHRPQTISAGNLPTGPGDDAAPPLTLESVLHVVGAAIGAPPPDPDAALLSSGIVDSLRTAELLDAFEDSFGVHLTIDDLEETSFDTGREMHHLLSRRRSM
jgi:acyl carrier protein